ncbi:MAG: hypothetical protein Q7R95_06880 [bacterium]|nr:hypothetical protein [bacterium]
MSENIRKPSSGLSLIQDIQLEHLLKSWNGGPFSTHVYTQLARIPQPIIEVVVFRKLEDAIETLIIPRPDDDIVWPGMYHNPGSALRTSDYSRSDSTPLNGPFERIQQSEIKTNFAYEPVLVTNLDRLTKRGPESCRVFFTELNGDPK